MTTKDHERPSPPRLSRLILSLALDRRDRAYALSDLEEEFAERCAANGARRARRWYRGQVVSSIAPALRGRFVSRREPAGPLPSQTSGTALLFDLLADVRLSARGLLKAPLVLVVTVLSLGAGIGVVTIAFALVNEVVVRPPTGLAEPERLVTVYRSQPFEPDGFEVVYLGPFRNAGVLPEVERGVRFAVPGGPRCGRGAFPATHDRLGALQHACGTGRQGPVLGDRVRRGRLLDSN